MKREKKNIASKTTMNLAIRERSTISKPYVLLPILIVILAVAALVGKFGVVDRYAQVAAAQREVARLEDSIRAMEEVYADFDQVQQEYNRYTYRDFDRTITDRLDVLSLIEREIFPVCYVRRVSVTSRQLAMSLEGLTLESTSALITRLNADPLVESVTVSTYDATSSGGTVHPITDMVIVLTDATAREEEVDQ